MNILSLALLSLALSGVSLAKKYVLDQKDYLPPIGYISEVKFSVRMLSDTLTLSVQDEKIDGALQSTTTVVEEYVTLAPLKYRSLIKSKISDGNMVIGEKVNEIPPKKEILLNVPVIWEKKNGKWTTSPEKGEFTEEQAIKLKEDRDRANKEVSMYGYTPREIGDVWDVDLAVLKTLLTEDNLTKGTAKITFEGIKKYNDLECAELVVDLDVEGKNEEGLTMRMKGKIYVFRSLKFLEDLKAHGDLALTMKAEPQPGMALNIKGNMAIKANTNLKAPAKQ